MIRRLSARPKVTDAERHGRFVAMTQQIAALDDVKDFEKAFQEAFKKAFQDAMLEKSSGPQPLIHSWYARIPKL
jgi:hypothetical protein